MAVLEVSTQAGIGIMTMNRPERHNAFTPEMFCLMKDTWDAWLQDDDIRVAIVTGAGGRAFCSGADLGVTAPLLTGERGVEQEWDKRVAADRSISRQAILRVYYPKPVIAAVDGICVAGGMEFLLGTDIRVASEKSTFGLPEVKRSLVPGGGSMSRLARQIPFCRAMEIMLTGDRITAAQALDMGLVNYVVPSEEVMPKALELANVLLQNGPLAIRAIKDVAVLTSGTSLDEAYAAEDKARDIVFASEDAREGPRAFMEKRPARFTGR